MEGNFPHRLAWKDRPIPIGMGLAVPYRVSEDLFWAETSHELVIRISVMIALLLFWAMPKAS